MKKIVALILLNIYLLNISGQLILHQYLVYKSDRFFKEQISKGLYNVNDLTEITIPVDLPAIHDWQAFENISGHITFGSATYNYVKIRMTRKALHLMCIPNYETTRFADSNVLDAKGIRDIPVSPKEHVPFGKIALQDNLTFSFIQFEFFCPVKYLPQIIIRHGQSPISHHLDIPEQPPKASC
ncbi:hypothetical protein [Mucilaginibacter rubeus]|uniref:Uncharacterized protein n=1 Tax=Mucilaginibacter rubeus TaxID=2027860 RepID=A0A5C1I4B5_9SPHI|nr:hypothetical protein [Mucilaginibacter rubeus]QEM12937.1 hypothetical protein DEO27_023975 [Mucilaginibacter rubeus]